MPNKLTRFLPIIAFIVVLFTIQDWWKVDLLLNPLPTDGISEHNIALYTTSWCPYCRKARTFFKQANIPYTEYDVEKSARAYEKYQQISGSGVPVIVIGERVIQGYDQKAIRAALNELSAIEQAPIKPDLTKPESSK